MTTSQPSKETEQEQLVEILCSPVKLLYNNTILAGNNRSVAEAYAAKLMPVITQSNIRVLEEFSTALKGKLRTSDGADELWAEVLRLSDADFPRWCA